MAVNFNILAREGPKNLYEGLVQGQEAATQNALAQQKMAQDKEMNALRVQQVRGEIGQQERKVKAETAAQKTAMFRDRLLRASNPNSVRELVKMQYADPDVGALLSQTGSLEQALAEVPDDPVQFERYRQQEALGMTEWMKSQLPKTVGGSIYDPAKSTFLTPPAVPKQTDLQLNYEAAKKQGFVGSIFDYEKKLKEAGRAPVQPVQPRAPAITTVEDPKNPGKFLQVDANQYKGGGAGSPGVIGAARPSALSEKTATQKVQLGKDINQAIFELKDAAKTGGLIDQSTGSGAGRLYDIGAGFFGSAPKGAIATGQLAPIADLVLKMVPRFEGPQSDKDTQSYKAAAGQLADSSLPTEIRKAAANEIIRLMEARKNQFGSADMAAPAGAGVAPPPGFNPD